MLERIRLQHARRRSANPHRLARSVQHNAAAQGLRLDDARGVCTLLRDYSIYENPPLILGGMMGISSMFARSARTTKSRAPAFPGALLVTVPILRSYTNLVKVSAIRIH